MTDWFIGLIEDVITFGFCIVCLITGGLALIGIPLLIAYTVFKMFGFVLGV